MKKTKKALLAVLACSAALAGVFGLAACNGGSDGDGGTTTPPAHEHNYVNWQSNENGTHTGTCNNTVGSCDSQTKTEDCNTDGKDGVEGACSVCGYKEEEDRTATVALGTDKVVASLDTTGLTLTLEGVEAGTSYTLSCTNDKVKFIVGTEQGNPVDFVYNKSLNIYVISTEGTLTNVTLKLEETPEPEFEAISLNDEVTVEGASEFEPVKYEIELAQGQYQIFIDGEAITLDMLAPVGIGVYVDGQFEYLNNIDDITVEVGEGKYYIEAYDNVTFKVAAASVHTHVWSWEVTDTPTAEGTGTATRTCTGTVGECGWEEDDLSVELPALDDEEYTVGKDTATCEAAGTQTYSITKDGKVVTFEVETPQKEKKLTEIASKSNGTTTIVLPSGGSLNLGNWKYYECEGCEKLFSMSADYSSNEARHVSENEIDFATKVSITVGSSTNFNGPAKIGDNRVYFTGKGGILFKAEVDGVYKISPEHATALFGIAYFGNTESSTTPSIVYKSGTTLDRTAKQYSRFNYTNFESLDGVYVRMDAGDVVGVAYTCVTKVDNFIVEKIDDVSTLNCYAHSYAYDVSSFDVNGGTFNYQCAFCGNEAVDLDSKEPITYTSGVVVNEANEGSPVALTANTLVVKTGVATGTYYSFTPSEAKDYEITFDTVLAGNTLTLKGIKCGDDTAATYGTALTVNSAFRSIIYVEKSATGTIVTIKVYADNVGKPFTFNFDVAGASADSPAYLTSVVSSNLPKFISEGESTVNIAAAYEFSEEYYFVSAEGGRFSLTVPEGVEVLMNGGEFITDDGSRAVNFSVSAGVRIGFAFKHVGGSTGDITVTVGEPVEETLPTVTTDGTTTVTLSVKSGTTGNFVGAVGLAEVGEITSGKYKLTVTFSPLLSGCYIAFAKGQEEATYFDFFDNNGNVRTDEDSATEAYVSTGNYATSTVEGVDYTVTGDVRTVTWTITLDLQEGDILAFANGGVSKGDITLSLEKVEG